MKYEVVFLPFTERHFIKKFAKKYKGAWERTLKGLITEFTYADFLFEKSIAETICVSKDNNIKICKTEFKIAGTEVSRHASGDRCVIAIHKNTYKVCVLLVYNKSDLGASNETAAWTGLVKDAYPEYSKIL